MEKRKLKEHWRYTISFIVTMLRRISKTISLKRFFKRQREGVMFLEIPTQIRTQAERDKFMEATMERLERIIYKK